MFTQNNTVCIILARGGSKRIPKKNLMVLNGLPLVAWSIQQALNSKTVDQVYVSTDDSNIALISKKYMANVIIRPAECSGDKATSESALLHAIEYIEKRRKIKTVVFLQPTSPIRSESDIDNAVKQYIEDGVDSLFSACKVEGFVWKKSFKCLESVNYNPSQREMSQDLKELVYEENGSIYVFSPETLRKHNSRIGRNPTIYEMPQWRSYQLDTLEDVEIISFFLQKIKKQNALGLLPAKIDLIVYDFDGTMTNNKVEVNEIGMESVVCIRSDGYGVYLIKKAGIQQLILSTEESKVVQARAKKLKIRAINPCYDKKQWLLTFCKDENISLSNVVYIGDGVNDLEVMKAVGCSLAPSDSCKEMLSVANIVLTSKGGDGVIYEFVGLLNAKKII